MMNHVSANTIEKLYLDPDSLGEQEKDGLVKHLEGCALCRELAERTEKFYRDLHEEMQFPPSERDRTAAEKILARERLALPLKAVTRKAEDALDAYAEVIEPYPFVWRKRAVRYLQAHPVKSVGGFSMAAALIVLAVLSFKPFKDTNPAYARAKDEFLVVYNKEGGELWRKHIGIGYDMKDMPSTIKGFYTSDNFLTAIDVDGDGKKEIVALFGWLVSLPMSNTIVCYNSDGSERWQYEMHRHMKFGDEVFSDGYFLRMMVTGCFDEKGKVEIIAVAQHETFYPTAVIRLNALNGKLLGEYWHCGSFTDIKAFDLNHDGVKEILLSGQNNGYNLASMSVLDPRAISGHSPAPPAYTPAYVPRGKEKFYILFPRDDTRIVSSQKRNIADGIIFTGDTLIHVRATENIDPSSTMLYFFDYSMRCVRVEADDCFIVMHRKMEAEGKLTKKLDAQYYEDLRKGVLYWDGEKFVNTPTMNKKYLEAKQKATFSSD